MKKYLISGCLSLALASINAQSIDRSVLGNAGDSYQYSSGTISWTIGEIATETLSQGNVIITQGFHQSYLNVSGLEDSPLITSDVSVYPSPTSQFIRVEIKNPNGTYIISITDLSGKEILDSKIEEGEKSKQFDLSTFADAMYLITIKSIELNKSDSYKIVKTR